MTTFTSLSDQAIFIDNIDVLHQCNQQGQRPKSSYPLRQQIHQQTKNSRRQDENSINRIIPFVYGCCMALVVVTLCLTVGTMNFEKRRTRINPSSFSTRQTTATTAALLNTVDHSNHRYLSSELPTVTNVTTPRSLFHENMETTSQRSTLAQELLNKNQNDYRSSSEEKDDLSFASSSVSHRSNVELLQRLNSSTLQERTKLLASKNELLVQRPNPRFVNSARRASQNITDYDSINSNTNVTKEIQLWFSVWFPTYNSDNQQDEDSSTALMSQLIDKENPMRQMVLSSFLQLLCQETDMSIVDNESSSDIDVCASLITPPSINSGRRRLRTQQQRAKTHKQQQLDRTLDQTDDADNGDQSIYSRSIILNQPVVAIRRRHERNSTASLSNETSLTRSGVAMNVSLAWTVWTVTYPVLKIGELYIKETVMTSYTDLYADSLKTMKEVVQLAIDVNLMDGKLDTIMEEKSADNETLPPSHASPIRLEWETFLPIYQQLYVTEPFVVRTWYSMRVAGLIMLLLSIVVPVTLTYLGNRRRRRLVETEQHHIKLIQTGNAEIVYDNNNNKDEWLTSNRGVEDMLHQSAKFRYTPGASDTFVIQGIGGDSEMASFGANGSAAPNQQLVTSPSNVGNIARSILTEQSSKPNPYAIDVGPNHHPSQQQCANSIHKNTPSPRNTFRITLSSDDEDGASSSGSSVSAGAMLHSK